MKVIGYTGNTLIDNVLITWVYKVNGFPSLQFHVLFCCFCSLSGNAIVYIDQQYDRLSYRSFAAWDVCFQSPLRVYNALHGVYRWTYGCRAIQQLAEWSSSCYRCLCCRYIEQRMGYVQLCRETEICVSKLVARCFYINSNVYYR